MSFAGQPPCGESDSPQGDLKFRQLLESLPAGAYTCDADGLITGYNARAVELWGRAPRLNDPVDRFCGSFRLFSPDGAPIRHDRCWMALALRNRQGYNGEEIVVERPDGSRRTALAHANPIRDEAGRIVGAVNVLVDVTDRQRTGEALRASEARLRTVVETTPDCIKVVDRDGTLLSMNAAGLDMCDVDRLDLVVGRSIYPVIAPEDREAFRAFNERICRGESGTLEFEIVGLRGMRRRMETRAAPLPTADGGFVHLAVTRDVTEQRRAEATLRDADRRKDEFLAMLAHELRNPLAPIRNAATLLGIKGLEAESAAEAREILVRQVDHLARLVDDLLDVSRIVRGKIELRKEPVELADIVRRAAEESQPALLESGHEFSVSLPAEPVRLDADPVRLAQVFSNLLNNAAKYTPSGGHVRLSAEREADGVAIHVRDDGAGIDRDLLPHVFDLFVQGEASIERSQGGLGIGLTLVKSLVELHDGSVTVRSEGRGRGSEFTVRLPVLADAPRTGIKSFTPAAVRPLRVLVVEDNVGAAKVLARMLQKFWGHETRTAFDGPSAVELAEEFRPELVLCDIGLPHLSGYDVARRLRCRPELADTLLVALTGYGTAEDRRRSCEAGFDEHVVKPAGVEALQTIFAHPKLAAIAPVWTTDEAGRPGRGD